MEKRYPCIQINLTRLKHNIDTVVAKCAAHGIRVAGVIKGAAGLTEVARQFELSDVACIATSRIEQLEEAAEAGIGKPKMLVRVPMLSEVHDVVRLAEYSLNSELTVVKALNGAAQAQGKVHQVIMMADVGDLREGYWDKEEMTEACVFIERELPHIHLAGIGYNVGCYGSIEPTAENLEELVAIAEGIEERIGRRLEYISGGATSTLMRIWDGDIPPRINHLRIGEGILLARDLDVFYGYDMSELYQDAFRFFAEVIEVKRKPTYPVGKFAVDAFGHTPEYIDRGIRKRALVGVGKVDYAYLPEMEPLEAGVEVLGASSDHTILDIEEAEKDFQVGDLVEFRLKYSTLVFLSRSKNMHFAYITE